MLAQAGLDGEVRAFRWHGVEELFVARDSEAARALEVVRASDANREGAVKEWKALMQQRRMNHARRKKRKNP